MRAPTREPVAARGPRCVLRTGILAAALCVTASCRSDDPAIALDQEHSPLARVARDADRLWLMTRAAGVNVDCERIETRIVQCTEDEEDLLDLLHANGVPEARPDHLSSPGFYGWLRAAQSQIDGCRVALRERRAAPTAQDLDDCDPYERLRATGPRLSALLTLPESSRLDVEGLRAVDLPGEPRAKTAP